MYKYKMGTYYGDMATVSKESMRLTLMRELIAMRSGTSASVEIKALEERTRRHGRPANLFLGKMRFVVEHIPNTDWTID